MMNDPIVIWPPGTWYHDYPDLEGWGCEAAHDTYGGEWQLCTEQRVPGFAIDCCPVF